MLSKKGAMFGLDARIALAIFGALSVISGAALYSAIKDSQATAMIVTLNEIGKGFEQYYLDTGSYPRRLDSSDNTKIEYYAYQTADLVKNPGVSGWKGPYLPYEIRVAPNDNRLVGPKNEDIWVSELTDDIDWSSTPVASACLSGVSCFLWARIWGSAYSESLKLSIDERIDNSDGPSKGDFRWDAGSFNLKYMPTKNPHD